VKARYNEVPWKEMAGMRDKLAHFYFGVKHEAERKRGIKRGIMSGKRTCVKLNC